MALTVGVLEFVDERLDGVQGLQFEFAVVVEIPLSEDTALLELLLVDCCF